MNEREQHPLGSGSVDPTPWPGNSPGTNAASGRAALTKLNGMQPRPHSFSNVCTWHSIGNAQPVALIVGVVGEREILTQMGGSSFIPGGDMVTPPLVLGGALRISYGLGAATRVLEADIRPGSYQLPPCEFASLDAFLFLSGPAAAVEVVGAIVPGLVPQPARFTSSFRQTLLAGGHANEALPAGARWVSMAGGATGIGAGQPILSLRHGVASVLLSHDYQTNVFLAPPGHPVELFNRDGLTLYNDGPDTVQVTVRCYLEV